MLTSPLIRARNTLFVYTTTTPRHIYTEYISSALVDGNYRSSESWNVILKTKIIFPPYNHPYTRVRSLSSTFISWSWKSRGNLNENSLLEDWKSLYTLHIITYTYFSFCHLLWFIGVWVRLEFFYSTAQSFIHMFQWTQFYEERENDYESKEARPQQMKIQTYLISSVERRFHKLGKESLVNKCVCTKHTNRRRVIWTR